MAALIEFEGVSKTFRGRKNTVHAVKDVSLTIESGEIFGVVGYSGAGKSTLIRLINALERPDSGNVYIGGQPINQLGGQTLRSARKSISMIFQQFNLLGSRTVTKNVAMPLLLNHVPREERYKRTRELLSFVELTDKADVYPSKLSGGQKQRVGIARALATNPRILLCDEATSALDPRTTDSILELLLKVNRELNVTIVMITHQMDVVRKICDRVAVMEDGRLIEIGTVQDVFEQPKEPNSQIFVDTVISKEIPAPVWEKALQEPRSYRIVRLRKIGDNVLDDLLPLLQRPDLVIKTLFASVNALKDSVLTVVALQLIGSKKQIQSAENTLQELEIPYELLAQSHDFRFSPEIPQL